MNAWILLDQFWAIFHGLIVVGGVHFAHGVAWFNVKWLWGVAGMQMGIVNVSNGDRIRVRISGHDEEYAVIADENTGVVFQRNNMCAACGENEIDPAFNDGDLPSLCGGCVAQANALIALRTFIEDAIDDRATHTARAVVLLREYDNRHWGDNMPFVDSEAGAMDDITSSGDDGIERVMDAARMLAVQRIPIPHNRA